LFIIKLLNYGHNKLRHAMKMKYGFGAKVTRRNDHSLDQCANLPEYLPP